jgi:hypothetical protein
MDTVMQEVVEVPVVEDVKVEQPVVEPVVEVAAPVVVPDEEFVYSYQPMDEYNRPLGSVQVFKGANAQEVLDKVANAHKESIKMARELKRKNRLGILDDENIPENVVRNQEDEALSQLSVEDRLVKVEEENSILRARAEAELFRQTTPQYYPCRENFETLTSWMVKNNLAPVRENFDYAFQKLSEVGLLLAAPIVREAIQPVPQEPVAPAIPANTQPEPVQASRITETVQAQQPRTAVRPASGLTKSTASDADIIPSKVTAVDQIVYVAPAKVITAKDGSIQRVIKEGTTYKGQAALDNMPADEYRRRLKDPAFQKAVNTFYAEFNKKAAQATE